MKMILEYEVGDTYPEIQKNIYDLFEDLLNITRPLADTLLHGIKQEFQDEEGNVQGTLVSAPSE